MLGLSHILSYSSLLPLHHEFIRKRIYIFLSWARCSFAYTVYISHTNTCQSKATVTKNNNRKKKQQQLTFIHFGCLELGISCKLAQGTTVKNEMEQAAFLSYWTKKNKKWRRSLERKKQTSSIMNLQINNGKQTLKIHINLMEKYFFEFCMDCAGWRRTTTKPTNLTHQNIDYNLLGFYSWF